VCGLWVLLTRDCRGRRVEEEEEARLAVTQAKRSLAF
jgi:hypothetical protein